MFVWVCRTSRLGQFAWLLAAGDASLDLDLGWNFEPIGEGELLVHTGAYGGRC
jgi:hypothetical protein